MTVQAHADRPVPGFRVHPVILMDDRFSERGDLVTVAFNPVSETILLHIAADGAGTATGILDETIAISIATALLAGAVRVDPENYRARAAHVLLADRYSEEPF